MSVTVDCSTNDLAVGLDPQTQQLRYTIELAGDLVFTLRSEKPATLLDDVSQPLERVWPLDASEIPGSTRAVHVLALAFGQGGTLRWLIEKLDGDEVVL
jgi:hypothetical protein